MIKSFDTNFSSGTSVATSSTGSGSMKKVIMFIAIVGVAYLGYKFVVKPMLDKNKEEK